MILCLNKWHCEIIKGAWQTIVTADHDIWIPTTLMPLRFFSIAFGIRSKVIIGDASGRFCNDIAFLNALNIVSKGWPLYPLQNVLKMQQNLKTYEELQNPCPTS